MDCFTADRTRGSSQGSIVKTVLGQGVLNVIASTGNPYIVTRGDTTGDVAHLLNLLLNQQCNGRPKPIWKIKDKAERQFIEEAGDTPHTRALVHSFPLVGNPMMPYIINTTKGRNNGKMGTVLDTRAI